MVSDNESCSTSRRRNAARSIQSSRLSASRIPDGFSAARVLERRQPFMSRKASRYIRRPTGISADSGDCSTVPTTSSVTAAACDAFPSMPQTKRPMTGHHRLAKFTTAALSPERARLNNTSSATVIIAFDIPTTSTNQTNEHRQNRLKPLSGVSWRGG